MNIRALAVLLIMAITLAAGAVSRRYYRPGWQRATNYGGYAPACLDHREQLLFARGQAVVDRDNCRVIGGIFPNDYTGGAFISLVGTDVHIDHLVPLRHLWDLYSARDGHPPNEHEWEAAANYDLNLFVTDAVTNVGKSDKLPDSWCPPDASVRPDLARAYMKVLEEFGLEEVAWEGEIRGAREWKWGRCLTASTGD